MGLSAYPVVIHVFELPLSHIIKTFLDPVLLETTAVPMGKNPLVRLGGTLACRHVVLSGAEAETVVVDADEVGASDDRAVRPCIYV